MIWGLFYCIFREEWEKGACYATADNRRGELWSDLVRREQVLEQDLQQEHARPGPVGNKWQQH